MLKLQPNISLKPYNTFSIDAIAKQFIDITSLSDLKDLVNTEKDFFILSGGSNLLLTKDIERLVVHLNTKGIAIIKETDNHIVVKVSAGENWHDFVMWCIDHNYGGIENLSLIPGNVGTTPIQNIGAYGTEVKDTIIEVEGLEIESNSIRIFTNNECEFGYRNSIFKNDQKGKYIITKVTFKLTKNDHKLNSSYGAIQSELEKNNIKKPTIKDISDAVIAIRQSKLPDPKEIGNSGSFFKNPVISKQQFKKLQMTYPDMPHYIITETTIKVPAGWLVEQCGFKGKRFGDAGVHKNQALVLVNYGNATGKEIWQLAQKIRKSVFEKYNIELEAEVNVI